MAKYTIELELTDQEVEDLARKAAAAGLTVPEILTAFIADLTDSDSCGGSDEYYKANEWYSRRGFSYLASYSGYDNSMLKCFHDNMKNLQDIVELADEGDDEGVNDFYTQYLDECEYMKIKPEPLPEALERIRRFMAAMPKEV